MPARVTLAAFAELLASGPPAGRKSTIELLFLSPVSALEMVHDAISSGRCTMQHAAEAGALTRALALIDEAEAVDVFEAAAQFVQRAADLKDGARALREQGALPRLVGALRSASKALQLAACGALAAVLLAVDDMQQFSRHQPHGRDVAGAAAGPAAGRPATAAGAGRPGPAARRAARGGQVPGRPDQLRRRAAGCAGAGGRRCCAAACAAAGLCRPQRGVLCHVCA
jgi:hypothetical protein